MPHFLRNIGSLACGVLLTLHGALAQPVSGASPVPMRFHLVDAEGDRQPWRSDGPETEAAGRNPIVGAGHGHGRPARVAVRSEDGREAYYTRGHDLNRVDIDRPRIPQTVERSSDLPELSHIVSMSWDTTKGNLVLLGSGVNEGMLHHFDTRLRRWGADHKVPLRNLAAVAHAPELGGFVALTFDGELARLSEEGNLRDLRPLQAFLSDWPTARRDLVHVKNGLQLRVEGRRVAIVAVNDRSAHVSHIWVYDWEAQQAQLSYREGGLSGAKPAFHAQDAWASGQRTETAAPMAPEWTPVPRHQAAPSQATLQAERLRRALCAVAVAALVLVLNVWRPARSWPQALALVLALLVPLIFAGWWGLQVMPVPKSLATGAALATLLGVGLLLVRPASAWVRGGVGAFTVGLAALPVYAMAMHLHQLKPLADEQDLGERLFAARCQGAGAHRGFAVGQVDAVRLTSVREALTPNAYNDPNWSDAGLPNDRVGEAYIRSYLSQSFDGAPSSSEWTIAGAPSRVIVAGYTQVDVRQPDGRYLRYRLGPEDAADAYRPRALLTEPIDPSDAARYAVSLSDTSLPGDREHWVAGAKVTVSDTQTGAILGELQTYAYAPPRFKDTQRLADRDWRMARTCPRYTDMAGLQARLFVETLVQRSH